MASNLRHWGATITVGDANDGATKAKERCSVLTQGRVGGDVDDDNN
jgi:hypothetical protein